MLIYEWWRGFEEFREKEINRLIESEDSATPIKEILTDDEILKYAVYI